ncbi:antimicrobial resistance protein Mig-14 [Erwinia endophytica]|uniref:antimicrobial resistance protein Mig-14 n=1 Tax=Erwinia endophytica TaxID=1563158 RepID=UPI001F040BE5|nr:antimicrobial resistance protein Mig-14 [Erwinia endophytica]
MNIWIMLIAKVLNWDECSLSDYKYSCLEYGYNCESAPEFLSFMLRHGAPLRFFSYKKKGITLGSVCVDHGWIANDIKNRNRSILHLPVPATSIYLPFSQDLKSKVIMPFKSKCLHPLQNKIFINTSYGLLSKRTAAFAKNINSDFSKKTITTREREIRNFLKSGGSFLSVDKMSGDQIFDIYQTLFFSRRKKEVSDQTINRSFFNEFHANFKGDVMFIGNEAIGIQLLLSVNSKSGFFVDFINIGYRQDSHINSLGTILMWRNLASLNAEAYKMRKTLNFSYGFMSGDYKKRWCNPAPVGKVLI